MSNKFKTTLFTDDFPIVTSDEELDLVKDKFKHLKYDHYYIATGCKKLRKKFDILWGKFKPYADPHFLLEIKKHFHQRTWEMYMACVFIKNGFRIESSYGKPDIKIVIGNKNIWIECVACDVGDGPDRVPPLEYNGEFQDYPEKQLILRITNSLDAKYDKYEEYLKKGIVDKKDVFIIALNRAALDHFDPGIPLIFKAVFGLEYLNFHISSLRSTNNKRKPFWSVRNEITKNNGKNISVKFFEDQKYSGISAIIYSNTNVLNHPKRIGKDCILVHNPLARNVLDEEIFSFLDQYRYAESKIINLQKR